MRRALEAQWREPGFTVPNATTYPWQWLWDSCFHAIIWGHLGDPERAIAELRAVFAHQSPSGFVPHMTYWGAPDTATDFWGRPMTSCITQPPMYGDAIAALIELGIAVPPDVVDAALAGLRHLVDRPRIDGLVAVVHPWETGCDDSPRWDHWCPGGWDADRWREVKGVLVEMIQFGADGAPCGNPAFAVAPVSFSALVVWNTHRLLAATDSRADEPELALGARELAAALATRWDASTSTYRDAGDSADSSGQVRTADAVLPLLVEDRPEVVRAVANALKDPHGLGAPFGPRGVDRREPAWDRRSYWRGPAWPQLIYLLWAAARAQRLETLASGLADAMLGGAIRSGLAEYWDADDATGLGAAPQSWTGLVLAMISSPIPQGQTTRSDGGGP